MSFLRPIQWYHSHADPIWPNGTFKASSCLYQAESACLTRLLVSVPGTLLSLPVQCFCLIPFQSPSWVYMFNASTSPVHVYFLSLPFNASTWPAPVLFPSLSVQCFACSCSRLFPVSACSLLLPVPLSVSFLSLQFNASACPVPVTFPSLQGQ